MSAGNCCPQKSNFCCRSAAIKSGRHPVAFIPVSTSLSIGERLAAWRVRLGFGRLNYRVKPGLYAVGRPGPRSEVLVSANYKLSFDKLRSSLAGQDLWILVLDTAGINVWCAAGKGSFSVAEIARRIEASDLRKVVEHRRLILPQLAAPGVAAHRLPGETGFRVIYGPVRAADLSRFLANDRRADPDMRRVTFSTGERLTVALIELVRVFKYFFVFALVLLAFLLLSGSLCPASVLRGGLPVLGALLAGTLLVPLLLPILPFRPFILKGWLAGLIWAFFMGLWLQPGFWGWLACLAALPVLTALVALNFTGSTTFTSQSGVNLEIKLYLRPAGILILLGLVALALELFL